MTVISKLGTLTTAVLLIAAGVLTPLETAQAYVGPGTGLTAIGTIIAFVAAFLLAIIGFVWYPLRRILRGRKVGGADVEAGSADAESKTTDS